MILKKEFQDRKSAMIYCSASVTKEYLVLKADDYFYNFVGRQVGLKFDVYIHPDFVDEFRECVASVAVGEEARVISLMKGADELYHLVDIFIHNDGETMSGQDIIDLRVCNLISTEHRYLRASNNIAKYRTFLSMYNDILFDYDNETDVFTILTYINNKINIIAKGSFEEVKEKVLSITDDDDEAKEKILEILNKVKGNCESFTEEFTGPDINDHNKSVHYFINSQSVYKHNRERISLGIIKREDVEETVPYYKKPEARDHFTGVYNKRACEELVNDLIKKNNGVHYLVMMDIDNFKNINDEYGHKVGDEVILKFAEIINKGISGRGFVGRFGGDEYFIFTNGIADEKNLRSMLTFIKQTMIKEFEKRFGGNGITCSMGVSRYPEDGDSYNKLFMCADKCLYIAKEKGKNRYIIYDKEKHGEVDADEDLSTGISAMQQDNDKMTDMISDIVTGLVSTKGEMLPKLLNDICSAFLSDGIRVYYSDNSSSDKALVYCHGDYRDMSGIESIDFINDIDVVFGSNSVLSVAIIANLELVRAEIYKVHVDAGIGGFYAIKHETDDGEIHVFLDTLGKKCNFSQSARNYARMLTNIIAEYI